jgi:hypothetical protein
MPAAPRTVSHGVANGVTIAPDISSLAGEPVTVTLSYAYARSAPAGAPTPPAFTGAKGGDYPRTFASGTVLKLHAYEAAALKAAGCAV